jgi:hypothetical protein
MGAYLIVVSAVLVAGLMADVVLRASARGSERSPVLIGLLAAILASIPVAAPAAMPEAQATAEPPALVVLFDASSAKLPQAEIRAAIGRELGCTVRDGFDPALGVVSVQVHQNEIVVGYQPPAGELERKLPVTAGAHQLPLLVALVAENLVYRDAGIVLPLAPPGVSDAPAPAPAETGRMVLAARVDDSARDRPVPVRPARAPSTEVRGAGFDLGARVGAFGRVSGAAKDGPGALSFGLIGRLNLPVAGRVRLAAEGGLARLASNPQTLGADLEGRPGRLWVAHVSVGPSVLLSRAGASSEVELSSSVGVTYPFAIQEENRDDRRAIADGSSNVVRDYHGEIGYRLAAALGFRRWLSERWAVHGAIGVEHHRLLASRSESEPASAAPPQQRLEAIRWTEPTLQAGASLRF